MSLRLRRIPVVRLAAEGVGCGACRPPRCRRPLGVAAAAQGGVPPRRLHVPAGRLRPHPGHVPGGGVGVEAVLGRPGIR